MTLNEYSKEIGLYEEMTLEDLISSHRKLRARSMQRHEEWLDELAKGREIGKQQGLEQVTFGDFIAKDKLKQMTLKEICEYIGTEE